MSVITANPSVLSIEGRNRASSKHLRHYQRVSELNLDQNSILSYLRSHDLHRTLAAFLSETTFSQNVEPLLKTIQEGGTSFSGDLSALLESIRCQCEGKQNKKSAKWLMVEFFLHIWYCLGETHLDKTRVPLLKHYIDVKGESLSELPQLLPYFALPFAENPIAHPFLKRIFAPQWKKELKRLIVDLTGKKQEHKHEEQWLNIIEDMIEICFEMFSHLRNAPHSSKTASMMERVKLYQLVIQKNKDEQLSHHQSSEALRTEIEALDLGAVEQVRSRIDRLRTQFSENKRLGSGLSLDLIYHRLQKEVRCLAEFKEDKPYVRQLVNHDIMCFKVRKPKMEFQELKLLSMLSSYFDGRSYIEQYGRITDILKTIIKEHSREVNLSLPHLQTLTVCFDVLRKMAIRPVVFRKVLEDEGLVDTVLATFETLKALFLKGAGTLCTKAFTYNAMALTQLVLHRKGREVLQRKHYFEMIASFFKRIATVCIEETLENELCSSLYLLLVEPAVRERANQLRLKEILLERMLWQKNPRYESLISYIVQRIEIDEDIEEGTSDVDEEKSVEYDSNIEVEDNIIYHRGQRLKVEDLSQLAGRKSKEVMEGNSNLLEGNGYTLEGKERKESQERKARRKVHSKGTYSPQKYEWKGSNSTYIRHPNHLDKL